MPHAISWEPRGIHARFFGDCSSADVIATFTEISDDARSDDLRFAIFNYLDVASQNASEPEMEEIAAHDIGIFHSNPRIIYASVTTDERIRELWHHFRSLNVMPERHALFSTLAEARQWIDGINRQPPLLWPQDAQR